MPFINLGQQLFNTNDVPESCDVVFVSDLFLSDYTGGAELTTEALLGASPLNVFRLHSSDVTMKSLEQGFKKFWVFGNFANIDQRLIPSICANLKYSVVEYDFKFCKYRSPEKHLSIEGVPCQCENTEHGKMTSAFLYGARSLWWMSERQLDTYLKLFPFLSEKSNTVLSSVFDDATFGAVKLLRDAAADKPRVGWIVLGSPSWIKGTADAEEWCKAQGHTYEVVWGLPYHQVLEKLSTAEGLVFLPKGADTCPRMVIEAKLLGCKLHLNDNVQHRDELWFDTDDMADTEAYLYLSRDRFWNGIKADMSYRPRISGYTTTKDCVKQDYPFEECITSMLGFCDEVIIVDGGSTDGTWEKLVSLSRGDARIRVHQQPRDWTHPRFAVFDGMQKALARSMCNGDMCWQQDSDEIVHENDYTKIRELARTMPKSLPMIALPVVEYWGGPDKVRMDVNVWKWRLSQNLPHITHGIPSSLREFDEDGELFSKPGCDGCFYIRNDNYEGIPFVNFITPDVEQLRLFGLNDRGAREQFELWFNQAVENVPGVHHFSWFNIKRKVRTYRDYWSLHWRSMHNEARDDTAASNMFFDKPWSDVSEDEIDALAKRLSDELGGWVFHSRVDFTRPVPHITCKRAAPAIMADWMKRNSQ